MKSVKMLSVFLSLFLTLTCSAADLDPRVSYHTDAVDKQLSQAEVYLKDNKLKFAEQQLTSAEKKLATIYKDYAGKFDESHPIMLDFKQRINHIKSQFNKGTTPTSHIQSVSAPVNYKELNIRPLVKAIESLLPKVKQAAKDGRYAVMELSSVESDYSKYRKQATLKAVLDDLQIKVARINALLPEAEMLVNDFRKQYPDQASLDNAFPKKASDLGFMVGSLENSLASWRKDRDQAMNLLIDSAMNNLKRSQDSLNSIDINKKAMARSTISDVTMWTINYYGYLIDAVPMVLQEQTKDTPEVLKLTASDKQIISQSNDFKQQLAQLEKQIALIQNNAEVAVQEKIKNARFPSNALPIGGDEKQVAQLLTEHFKTEPLRLAVYAPWEETTRAKWINDIWTVETYKSLGVWVLKKNKSGKYFVYQVTMRNKQSSDGTWGPMHYWTIGSSYEILEGNIYL